MTLSDLGLAAVQLPILVMYGAFILGALVDLIPGKPLQFSGNDAGGKPNVPGTRPGVKIHDNQQESTVERRF